MTRFRRHRKRMPPPVAPAVEAYLDGSYAAFVTKLGKTVPPWAWLNRCAHGELETLRALAPARLGDTWARAERVLADELLLIVEDDEELLSRIQCHVLIPLEMALIDREAHEHLTAPGLVLSVRAALRSSLS